MKYKKLFISVGIVGIIGMILMLISLAILNFDFYSLDMEEEYNGMTYEANISEVSQIEIYTYDMDVSIKYSESESDKIKLNYCENKSKKAEITLNDGVLKFDDKRNTVQDIFRNIFGMDGILNGLKRSKFEFVLEIPKGCDNLNLTVHTSNGKIDANGIDAKNLDLKSSNSSIDVGGTVSENVMCVTSNGRITSDGLSAKEACFYTSNADCRVGNIVCDKLEAKSSNGGIICDDVVANSVWLKTSNGNIVTGNINKLTAENPDSTTGQLLFMTGIDITGESVFMSTSNASINTKSINAKNIELHSSNGGINAEIAGDDKDFRIESRTSNANNNLAGFGNDSVTDKTLKVYTSNADINVRFED